MKLFNHIKNYLSLLLLLLFISCNKTNWIENYKEKKKSPFGIFIIHNEIKELLDNQEIVNLDENIYDYLYHNYEEGQNFGNYICIKNDAKKINEDGVTEILRSVYNGSNAFFSLNYFSQHLKRTLNFTTNNLDAFVFGVSQLKLLKGKLSLENKTFKNQSFEFDRNIRRNYFLTFNKKNSIVLGNIEVDGEKVPNFIKVYYGKGAVYLHTQPIAFTNYFLLSNQEEYAANLLSYLPNLETLWDPQIKWSKLSKKEVKKKDSIFKFFLQHPTLKWFLFLSLISLSLFMLFNARRKQRPIPVIEPLKNSTVEFTHTIANLYLKEEDHKNLVDKKIMFFLEKVRTKYLINTNNLNSNFIERLALKSGNKLANTKYLINTINALHKKYECSEEELIVLNKMIENFFKHE